MRFLWLASAVIIGLAAVIFLLGQLGFLRGRMPTNLGVRDGQLKPPSNTRNSVSSQAYLHPEHQQKKYADIRPLKFDGDADQAFLRLTDILRKIDRFVIVAQEPDYVYGQSTTSWLKFVDDVEFALDRTASVIHVRSASRIGREDFNVNRARIETIRAQFEKS